MQNKLNDSSNIRGLHNNDCTILRLIKRIFLLQPAMAMNMMRLHSGLMIVEQASSKSKKLRCKIVRYMHWNLIHTSEHVVSYVNNE